MSSAAITIFSQPRAQLVRRPSVPIRRQVGPLCCASILFVALVLQLSIRIAIIQYSYTIEGLRQNNLDQDREIRQLRLTYETMLTPSTLRQRATDELGMIQIKPQQIRHVTVNSEVK